MKKVTISTYKKDKYYPRVTRAFAELLSKSDVVSPVEVFISMGSLTKKKYELWRHGKVPFLERVLEGNLSKINRILTIISFHAHDLNMVPSISHYHKWGKGKKDLLKFSKSGNKKLEERYSRHFLWNRSAEKKLEVINQTESELEHLLELY
jgi:hypothetical protein